MIDQCRIDRESAMNEMELVVELITEQVQNCMGAEIKW